MLSVVVRYEDFVRCNGSRRRAALVAAYGTNVGSDAAEALAYGFEHWDDVAGMANPAGYLYRVGQTEARRHFRPSPFLAPRPTRHQICRVPEPRRTGQSSGATLRVVFERSDVNTYSAPGRSEINRHHSSHQAIPIAALGHSVCPLEKDSPWALTSLSSISSHS